MRNYFLFILPLFGWSCFELNAMNYLSVTSETGFPIEDVKIIQNHSIVKTLTAKGNEVKLHFFAQRSLQKGDGVELFLSNETTPLKICWDYEDRADYYPIPIESNEKWVIVRKEGTQRYCFLVVSREKALEIAKTQLQRGEECKAVQRQVGLKESDILQIQTDLQKN